MCGCPHAPGTAPMVPRRVTESRLTVCRFRCLCLCVCCVSAGFDAVGGTRSGDLRHHQGRRRAPKRLHRAHRVGGTYAPPPVVWLRQNFRFHVEPFPGVNLMCGLDECGGHAMECVFGVKAAVLSAAVASLSLLAFPHRYFLAELHVPGGDGVPRLRPHQQVRRRLAGCPLLRRRHRNRASLPCELTVFVSFRRCAVGFGRYPVAFAMCRHLCCVYVCVCVAVCMYVCMWWWCRTRSSGCVNPARWRRTA